MAIDDSNIKFVFYLNGNKYIVFSLKENIEIGDDLYFAKEISEGVNDSVTDDEYSEVLKEYEEYLNCVREDNLDEN